MYTLYDSVFGTIENYDELPTEDEVLADFYEFISAQHNWTLVNEDTGEEVEPA